ncbi:hypothetical protein KY290_002860, partial [Solanum tuberosum]
RVQICRMLLYYLLYSVLLMLPASIDFINSRVCWLHTNLLSITTLNASHSTRFRHIADVIAGSFYVFSHHLYAVIQPGGSNP